MRICSGLAASIACAIVASPAMAIEPGGYSPDDRVAIASYVLTTAKMQRWLAANADLKAARKADSALRADEADLAQSNDSLAHLLTAMRRHPAFTRFFHRRGLTDRDAVLFPVAVANAFVADAAGLDMDGNPAFATTPQITFCRAHKAELGDVLRR